MESAVGTVNGVKKVTSNSAENSSMVMLQFQDDTNMDAAMVKVSSAGQSVGTTGYSGTADDHGNLDGHDVNGYGKCRL